MVSPFTIVVLYPVSWISVCFCMLENWLFRGILLQYLSVKGQLQCKFFISINELWLYKITIYVINCLSKIK